MIAEVFSTKSLFRPLLWRCRLMVGSDNEVLFVSAKAYLSRVECEDALATLCRQLPEASKTVSYA